MLSPRSRFRKASGVLLAVYLGLFLTLLPALHNHGSCLDCRGDGLGPSRFEETRTESAGCRPGCSGCAGEVSPSPPAYSGHAWVEATDAAECCVACDFLEDTRLFAVVPSVSLEAIRLRESLPFAPEAPDRLRGPYRRLPRGPPAA